jgi:uncharacterized phage protein (TIGR02218 family)
MRDISPALAAHLSSGATTLCTCWKIERRDGGTLGFTDHDMDVQFNEMTFTAGTGLEGSSSETLLGFAASGSENKGILRAGSLEAQDLANGLYDGATIDTWRVNWRNPSEHVLLDKAWFGQVRRTGEAFTVELRSVSSLFDQPAGRLFQTSCNAELGDARCGVDMNDPQRSLIATVTSVSSGSMIELSSVPFATGLLNGGKLEVLGGPLTGQTREIESNSVQGGKSFIRVWQPFATEIAPETEVRVSMGCDKSIATCRDRFGNQQRFRGFPHMPGNDALLSHAVGSSAKMDGGSLFK